MEMLDKVADVPDEARMTGETSRFHSPTFKRAKKRRMLVKSPNVNLRPD